MPCRVCTGPTSPSFPGWVHCAACGSASSLLTYEEVKNLYQTQEYLDYNLQTNGSRQALLRSMETNFKYFEVYRGWTPEFTFLDVGCLEGCGMEGMQDHCGWSIHGFDVTPLARTGPHVTIAPEFKASLFPRRYGAVMVREVLEHVPDWRDFLHQLHLVTLPFGFCQIQTPLPTSFFNPISYQDAHLQLFSPAALRSALQQQGFEIVEELFWETGQLFHCRNHS